MMALGSIDEIRNRRAGDRFGCVYVSGLGYEGLYVVCLLEGKTTDDPVRS